MKDLNELKRQMMLDNGIESEETIEIFLTLLEPFDVETSQKYIDIFTEAVEERCNEIIAQELAGR